MTTGQTNLPDNVHCPDYRPEKHAVSSLVHSLAHPRSKNPQCILYTALQGQTELVGEKNGNPWCTDVSRSLTRFPSRSAHARERDAENPPWVVRSMRGNPIVQTAHAQGGLGHHAATGGWSASFTFNTIYSVINILNIMEEGEHRS